MGSRPSNYNRMTKFWFSWSGASSPYVTRFYIAKRVWLLCLSRVCPRPSWNNVSRFNWIFFRLFAPPFVSWLPFILLLSLPEREIVLIIAFSNDRCEALGRCFLFRLLSVDHRLFISLRGTFAFIGFYFDLFFTITGCKKHLHVIVLSISQAHLY